MKEAERGKELGAARGEAPEPGEPKQQS